jgi:hypothetical protein
MEIVEQPFAGGAHVGSAVGGGRELGIDVVQDFPRLVEPVEQREMTPLARRLGEPLRSGDGPGALGQVLGAEQLALNWPGAQVIPAVGGSCSGLGTKAGKFDWGDVSDLSKA